MWECGLKPILWIEELKGVIVTPYVGVWIETFYPSHYKNHSNVTPYVGVWIETWRYACKYDGTDSHSLCGSVD